MSEEEEIEKLERKVEALKELVGDIERRLERPKRHFGNEEYLGISVILAITLIMSYQIVDSTNTIFEIISICIFLAYFIISAYFELDFRISIVTAIFLLVFCAVTLTLSFGSLANQGAIIAYYFLAFGVLGLVINYLRESRQSSGIDERD